MKQKVSAWLAGYLQQRGRLRLFHHNLRAKKETQNAEVTIRKCKKAIGFSSTAAKFCWSDGRMWKNDTGQASNIKMLKQCNLQCLPVSSSASRFAAEQQIKSGLSSDTQWETCSICMIYLLRQMKSVSAHSSIQEKEEKKSFWCHIPGRKRNFNTIRFCHNLFFSPFTPTGPHKCLSEEDTHCNESLARAVHTGRQSLNIIFKSVFVMILFWKDKLDDQKILHVCTNCGSSSCLK